MLDALPNLTAGFNERHIRLLNQLHSTLAQTIASWQPVTVQYTDHSLAHNESILRFIDIYLAEQKQRLRPVEGFILVAAVYLHDVGLLVGDRLRDAQGRLPIQCYRHDLRRQHANLSAAVILDRNLQQQAAFTLPEFTGPEFALVAELCRCHDKMEFLGRIDREMIIDGTTTRPRLMAALLILGDCAQTGRRRVLVDNLGTAELPLEQRIFWYSYSCIVDVRIVGSSLALALARSPEITSTVFVQHVAKPVSGFFSRLLDHVNPVLHDAGFPKLDLDTSISVEALPHTDTTRAILAAAVLEDGIRLRNEKRKKAINAKIKKKGMIERRLVNNELVVLRRWSSYTPRMPKWNGAKGVALPSPSESRGGGYFLVWQHTGIVIDPGYDFLRNFWTQPVYGPDGFELSDIHAVILSHAHDDHTHDIEPILSLFHKRQKLTGRKRVIPLYMSEGTHCKYQRLLSISDTASVMDLIPDIGPTTAPADESFLREKGIVLEFIRSDHNEMPWMRNNTGISLRLSLKDERSQVTLGYTSDTRFSTELAQFLAECDVVMMHFGNLGPPSGAKMGYDKNHLGLNGCHDLLTALASSRVRLFLMDEFGEEEVGGDRIAVCDLLARMCALGSFGKTLLPMDIGMRIRLPSLEVLCQEATHSHWVSHNTIVPHQPSGADGIVYFCK